MPRLAAAARLLAWIALAATGPGQDLGELKVGHWVEIRGDLGQDGRFVASAVQAMTPTKHEVLIGTARSVDVSRDSFTLLGRVVRVSDRTQWSELSLRGVEGRRIKMEGYWRGGAFSARQIAPRGEGRDRLGGRIDELRRTPKGLELAVLGFQVDVPGEAKIEHDLPWAELPLAPEIPRELAGAVSADRDEDYVPGTLRLGRNWTFGGLLEHKSIHEDDFDLDRSQSGDLTVQRTSFKAQLAWVPSDSFHALASVRSQLEDRVDQNGSDSTLVTTETEEFWGYWSDVGGSGFDIQFGRQILADDRQWLFRESLDGVRLVWSRPSFRMDLSATTLLFEGSGTADSRNLIAYVSNNDPHRELAAYVIDRRDEDGQPNDPIWFGTRAIGSFLPQNESWAEASLLRGYADDINLKGYAIDVGTTWSPAWSERVSFTGGWALGSGDDSGSSTTDESFRQTGLQRNKDKWSGVKSFRYYGELLDPELSNLSILTCGVGTRLARKTSLDLVWHHYVQVASATFLRDSNLDRDPDGVHDDLGQELDLVLSTKILSGWDFSLIGGWFRPGAAFPGGDDAYLGTFQVRFRF